MNWKPLAGEDEVNGDVYLCETYATKNKSTLWTMMFSKYIIKPMCMLIKILMLSIKANIFM